MANFNRMETCAKDSVSSLDFAHLDRSLTNELVPEFCTAVVHSDANSKPHTQLREEWNVYSKYCVCILFNFSCKIFYAPPMGKLTSQIKSALIADSVSFNAKFRLYKLW